MIPNTIDKVSHGVYVGSPTSKRHRSLRGKGALLRRASTPDKVLVQFDDRATGLGYGWHEFPAAHFQPSCSPNS